MVHETVTNSSGMKHVSPAENCRVSYKYLKVACNVRDLSDMEEQFEHQHFFFIISSGYMRRRSVRRQLSCET
jgi:hypothetical protein